MSFNMRMRSVFSRHRWPFLMCTDCTSKTHSSLCAKQRGNYVCYRERSPFIQIMLGIINKLLSKIRTETESCTAVQWRACSAVQPCIQARPSQPVSHQHSDERQDLRPLRRPFSVEITGRLHQTIKDTLSWLQTQFCPVAKSISPHL